MWELARLLRRRGVSGHGPAAPPRGCCAGLFWGTVQPSSLHLHLSSPPSPCQWFLARTSALEALSSSRVDLDAAGTVLRDVYHCGELGTRHRRASFAAPSAGACRPPAAAGAPRRVGKHSTARSAALAAVGSPRTRCACATRTRRVGCRATPRSAPRRELPVAFSFLGSQAKCRPERATQRARRLGRPRALASAPDALQEMSMKGQSREFHARSQNYGGPSV